MAKPLTVKVSSRYQIAVPASARSKLNIKRGDRLLVDIQDGMILLIPKPVSYTNHLSGLHHEIWENIDTEAYLRKERDAWERSQTD